MNKMSEEYFQEHQLKKRTEFHEIIHAAFILETSASFYLSRPKPTKKELEWLGAAYPGSIIEEGVDQGAGYYTITPKF